MVEHVGECDYVQTCVRDRIELIDGQTVENVVKVVQLENITR